MYKKLVIIRSQNYFVWEIYLQGWFLSHCPVLSKLSVCKIVHLLGRIPIILNIRAHCNFGHFKSSVSVVYQLHKEGMLASRVENVCDSGRTEQPFEMLAADHTYS